MIKAKCIFCDHEFSINTYGDLKDHQGYTLDCPICKRTMVIEDGELLDFNLALKVCCAEMGYRTEEDRDYSRQYLEV